MPTYKLTYFNTKGFGETIRMVFAQAGVEYEDVRLEKEEWLKYKPNTPFGQMPVLDVDGFQVSDSQAIARFLAREFGLAGKTRQEEALVDMYAAAAYDLIKPCVEILYSSDKDKQDELKKKYAEEGAPKFLDRFESTLADSKNGFLVGDGVSWVDILVFNFIPWVIITLPSDMVAKYPKIQAHIKQIEALPRIAEWLKKRPVTER